MKKLSFLSLTILLFTFLLSCDSEVLDMEFEPQITESTDGEQVFFPGEVSQSTTSRLTANSFGCGVTGPDCASSGQTLTYTYSTTTSNPNITWTVNSGSISIVSGQNSNTVSLRFGRGFTGGTVTVLGAGAPNCSVTFDILKCATPVPTCGISINGIFEVNALGDDEVAFYATTTISSGWSVTGSYFTVTYQNGSVSNHVGYTNSLGYEQIIIPVSCTNKVETVQVSVYGASSSGTTCSDTELEDWGVIGVCGTGGFN
ncbi:hypothetical protein GCM10011506_42570 [Marivirga lumbricoides]|uniref:Ig-like domain-containing protein n=1 Tax=Marivirga lumbricoides TaxID=1046115 RepID=A0ABQ1N3S6_9BACT|nr:hypothetical protein GCM10011506_42570 [Marivirga lumbricoides]